MIPARFLLVGKALEAGLTRGVNAAARAVDKCQFVTGMVGAAEATFTDVWINDVAAGTLRDRKS